MMGCRHGAGGGRSARGAFHNRPRDAVGLSRATLKVATNTELARRKKSWIDFDAGRLLSQPSSMDALADELYGLVLEIAGGLATRNELGGISRIAIWKTGVTL